MSSEFEKTGMTPEQKFGLAAGAAFAVAGLTMALVRRRKKKTPVQQTADKLLENPSLKNLYGTARGSLDEAKGKIDSKPFEKARDELIHASEAVPEKWHKEVEPRAKDLAERAVETAQKIGAEGAERSREFSKRWEKEYAPAAKSFAEDAVEEAEEVLASARKKAGEISDTARKDYIPKIVPMATAASEAVGEALSDGSDKLQKKVKEGKKDISLPKSKQPGVFKRAGQSAASTAGNVLMIGFWGAALGTVVYYGILDEEKRAKVRNFFTDAWEQVTELIEDFQDDDIFDDPEGTERF